MRWKTKGHVMDVDLNMLRTMSIDLAEKIKQAGYIPEHIIYVERAGILTGYELSKFFNCSISGIHSRRSGSRFKSRIKMILRFLPRFITHFLRRMELKSSVHRLKNTRHVSYKGLLPPKDTAILVVDDALDTGHSMASVLDWLNAQGFKSENIKTAVLTTTGKIACFVADFSLLNQVICAFPWSYDSRQYELAKFRMKAVRQRIYDSSASFPDHNHRPVTGFIGFNHS